MNCVVYKSGNFLIYFIAAGYNEVASKAISISILFYN